MKKTPIISILWIAILLLVAIVLCFLSEKTFLFIMGVMVILSLVAAFSITIIAGQNIIWWLEDKYLK